MKVTFIAPMAGRDILYLTDVVYDLSKEQAKKFIAHGICELAEEVKEIEVKKAVVNNNFKSKKNKKK